MEEQNNIEVNEQEIMETVEQTNEVVNEEPKHEPTEADFAGLNRNEIIEKIRFYVQESDKEDCKKEVEILRKMYYKVRKEEFEKYKKEQQANLGEDVNIEMPKDTDEDYLKELLTDFNKKQNEIIKQKEAVKEQNLKAKLDIIEKIKQLASNGDSVNKTYADFKELQKKFLEIGPVPQSENKAVWESYQIHTANYYNLLKINREFRELDYKKNLEQKIVLCEKMEGLLLEKEIVSAFKKSQELYKEWKEIGPVSKDKSEEIWDRFIDTKQKVSNNYQEHITKQKQEREANYEQKIILCEKAEAIVAYENMPQKASEWTKASESILELQKIWKTVGMVPTEVNTEIFERFRAACNKFFDAKKEFFSKITNELDENLSKKTELCVAAESLKDSTEWKKTTEMFYDLQRKWKEIGPVPHKYSEQIWGRFRAACNHFFEEKNRYYSNIEADHQYNLEQKEQLIAEVKEYTPVEDQVANVEKIKEFKTRWNEIGYVATADKDRLYKEFKNAIDKIFEQIKLDKNDIELSSYNTQIEQIKESGEISVLIKERNNITKKIQDLNAEVTQIENNIGFFSNGSNNIVNEFNRKIEKIKNEIAVLKEKKKAIDIAERELKKSDKNE